MVPCARISCLRQRRDGGRPTHEDDAEDRVRHSLEVTGRRLANELGERERERTAAAGWPCLRRGAMPVARRAEHAACRRRAGRLVDGRAKSASAFDRERDERAPSEAIEGSGREAARAREKRSTRRTTGEAHEAQPPSSALRRRRGLRGHWRKGLTRRTERVDKRAERGRGCTSRIETAAPRASVQPRASPAAALRRAPEPTPAARGRRAMRERQRRRRRPIILPIDNLFGAAIRA